MALTYPSLSDLSAQAQAEIRRQLPDVDPTIQGSFAKAFLDSAALLAQTNNLTIADLEKQLFPQSAEGEFLDLWGGYEGLPRKEASRSTGNTSGAGTAGTVIPSGTVFSYNGLEYQSTAVAVVDTVSQSISSITRSGTVATVTTPADHSLATGLSVTVSGADQADYNGSFDVVVTARNQFQYTVSGSPTTPATGTISYSGVYAVINLESVDTGLSVNADAGAVFSIQEPVTGFDGQCIAGIDGISGGSEIEEDEDYRARILLSRSLQEGVFTEGQVKLAALGVAGNTRAFVQTPTISVADTPAPGMVVVPGQTAVYILRDNDPNPIPTQTVLNNTKAAIIANGKLPANTYSGDLFVFAPITVQTDFVFSSLIPNTATMRSAVTAQLQAFFEDTADFQEDIQEAAYLGAIQNTIDATTSTPLVSFSLSSPTGNISVSTGEIAVLGDVTFS